MADLNVKEVREMAYDLYKGRTGKFDAESANEAIKNIILEAGGCKDHWDMYTFMKNKYDVFAIMRDIITPIVAENTIDRFQSWCDIVNIGLGDTYDFEVLNMDLFKIGYVADGTSELRRQTLVKGKLAMRAFPLGAKFYVEFDDFRRGRIDFAMLIDRMALSFENEIAKIIVKLVEESYDKLTANFKKSGAYSDDAMLELVQRVQAKSGMQPVIYGTKVALANLRKNNQGIFSDEDKRAVSNTGYVGTYFGTPVVELPQSLDRKDNFMINDKMLYVIPNGTKIVKLLFEGDMDVVECTDNAKRMDMQLEYMFMQRIQLGVAKANVYGIYKIS